MDKKEDVSEFEKLEQQLHSFLDEMSELSRKKPDGPVNKFKLQFINSAIKALNRLLGDHRPFKDFGTFDVDDLPTNSDVVLILAQYAAATYNLRREQTEKGGYGAEWYWIVRGRVSDLETKAPESSKYRPK